MNDQHPLIRQFNVITLFILGLLLTFSCIWSYFSNYALAEEATLERARYIAGAISDSLTHAMEVGIPLESMREVNTLLRTRANDNDNIQHLAVLSLTGGKMWQAVGASQDAQTVQATADVRFRGRTVAYVQVSVYLSDVLNLMVAAVFLQIILFMMAYIACYESIIFSLGRGVVLRQRARKEMQKAILSGKLNTVTIGQNRSASDTILYGMVLRLRGLNEKIWRMRRLTASLRLTEPDPEIRAELETTLAKAEGSAIFADRKPDVVVLSSIGVDMRWFYFLTCVAIESTLQAMVPDTIAWTSPLLVLLNALGLLLGIFFAYKLAAKRSLQALINWGGLIIFLGFLVVWMLPLSIYSVCARLMVALGSMIILFGGYGAVEREQGSYRWFIVIITGGIFLGRMLSLIVLEWFGSRVLVTSAAILLLWTILLVNRAALSYPSTWARVIGDITFPTFKLKPISLCNGVISGLLFSFALASFVFNEGFGNEMFITLFWCLLGLGAWFGCQLPLQLRPALWGLALIVTGLLIFEHELPDVLSLLFCLSLSTLDWHVRVQDHKAWPFNLSDLFGISIGASFYLFIVYFFPSTNMSIVFFSLLFLLGGLLFWPRILLIVYRERS